MGEKEQHFLFICPDLLFLLLKNTLFIFTTFLQEESYVIAEFIALRFFGISSLQIS